jgi:hypothetical protein
MATHSSNPAYNVVLRAGSNCKSAVWPLFVWQEGEGEISQKNPNLNFQKKIIVPAFRHLKKNTSNAKKNPSNMTSSPLFTEGLSPKIVQFSRSKSFCRSFLRRPKKPPNLRRKIEFCQNKKSAFLNYPTPK